MAVEVVVARRLFTREEYHRMGEAGILRPTDRVELIQLLIVRLAGRAIVAVQGPIVLAADTEPEPDVAIIRRRRPVLYKEREAHAEDALLLIEVAESSLAYDRSTKLRLYAAAVAPQVFPGVALTLAEIFA
ncbi:MAG: Uma2 family endonuclease [Candidatus Rokubacteria bacterium]|nr:Uma2 family endonuclease [Candidatus Rokubacteria bacterium]